MTRSRYTAAELGRVLMKMFITNTEDTPLFFYTWQCPSMEKEYLSIYLFNVLKEYEFTIIPHRERENNNNNKNKGNKKNKKWK